VVLGRRDAELAQPLRGGTGEVEVGELRQWVTAPERQTVLDEVERGAVVRDT
jgi:hypothetical protein